MFSMLSGRCFYILTLEEEKFYWNLNFAISIMANSLNLDSAYYIYRNLSMIAYHYSFRNLSMIAYTVEIQKSNFANV